MKIRTKILVAVVVAMASPACAFTPMFSAVKSMQKTVPSSVEGVDIELPDFDELFRRIQEVSPLSRLLIQNGGGRNARRGFAAIDKKDNLKWKVLEEDMRKPAQSIEKIDNFNGHKYPMLRFRSTLEGPCVGDAFAAFKTDLSERSKWDYSVEQVYEKYPIKDTSLASMAMNVEKYGVCKRLGIGYCRTKSYLMVPGREQLTLCGIQHFPDGSCMIWGTEMDEKHDHLLPPGSRVPRAKSHLFSATMVPTDDTGFDLEYCLQLEVGKLPSWVTTPIVVESIKRLFGYAESFYAGGPDSSLPSFLESRQALEEQMGARSSLLLTPC